VPLLTLDGPKNRLAKSKLVDGIGHHLVQLFKIET